MQRTASGRGFRGGSAGASSTGFSTPVPQSANNSGWDNSNSIRPPAPKDCYYLTQDEEPLGPYAAIASTQALMSTFPSRIRLGTSTLMQPSVLSQPKEAAPRPSVVPAAPPQAPAPAPTPTTQAPSTPVPEIPPEYGLGRRARAQAVNYSESGPLDFEEDIKDQSPAPEANLTSRGRSLASRKDSKHQPLASTSSAILTNGKDKEARQQSAVQAVQKWIPPRSYLDSAPPGNLVLVEPAKRTRHIYLSQHTLQAKATKRSVLVPIRIEVDTDIHRIRDQLTWNTQEDTVTPEHFAAIFCEDLGLPETHRRQISLSIRQQLEEHASVAEISLEPDVDDSVVTPADRLESDPDLRVILNIDVQLGMLRLVDKMEWDLGSPHSPDLVARSLCQDLALPTEAAPTIAHAMHEEILKAKRECLEMGILGDQMHMRGAKRLEGVWREWSDTLDFGPRVEYMDWEELERYEKEKERVSKRAKRNVVSTGARRRR